MKGKDYSFGQNIVENIDDFLKSKMQTIQEAKEKEVKEKKEKKKKNKTKKDNK